jgi:hypothetical protein
VVLESRWKVFLVVDFADEQEARIFYRISIESEGNFLEALSQAELALSSM